MKMKISNQVNCIKEDKGITLIALIVTVIVLAILVGVSVGTISGNNGIINKTMDATDKTNQLTAEEKVETEVANSYGKNGKIDLDKLNENLKNNIKGLELNGSPISDSNKIESLPVTVVVDGYEVVIDDDTISEIPNNFLYGDVDQNEEVNILDNTLLTIYLNGNVTFTELQKKAADVDGDGEITELDLDILGFYNAHFITVFPAEDPNVKYYTLGDVNLDEKVDSEDVELIKEYIDNKESIENGSMKNPLGGSQSFFQIGKKAADVNEDGVIDYRDLEKIQEMIN